MYFKEKKYQTIHNYPIVDQLYRTEKIQSSSNICNQKGWVNNWMDEYVPVCQQL